MPFRTALDEVRSLAARGADLDEIDAAIIEPGSRDGLSDAQAGALWLVAHADVEFFAEHRAGRERYAARQAHIFAAIPVAPPPGSD